MSELAQKIDWKIGNLNTEKTPMETCDILELLNKRIDEEVYELKNEINKLKNKEQGEPDPFDVAKIGERMIHHGHEPGTSELWDESFVYAMEDLYGLESKLNNYFNKEKK